MRDDQDALNGSCEQTCLEKENMIMHSHQNICKQMEEGWSFMDNNCRTDARDIEQRTCRP